MGALRRLLSAGLVWLCVLVGGLVFGGVPALAVTKHVFSSSFGSFTGPVGIGVDRVSGAVYVADAEGLAVDRFDGTGEALSPAQMSGVSFGEPYGLAVDNSGGITQGDVYVADYVDGVLDKFNSEGEYLSQITGLSHPAGVAVDGEGNVYVSELASGQVDKFNNSGEPDPGNPIATALNSPVALAVDGEGHIYAATGNGTIELDAAGVCVQSECAALDPAGHNGVATDSEGNVYADDGTSIAEYDSAGSLVERFGEGTLSEGYGVAVNATKVYVVDYAAKTADILTDVLLPDPVTGEASGVSSSGAALHGTVNPDGVEAACSFEYGVEEAYGSSVACSEGAGSGTSPVPVTAELSGLQPNQTYHYRLLASNENGSNPGQDQTFTTQAIAPTVSGTSASNIATTSATLGAQVNPNGSDTTYYFQYGTSTSYGTSVPAPPGTDIGSGREAQTVSVHVQGLQQSTTYHYRVIAVDAAGTIEGPDRTLSTPSPGGPFALPDGRAYELVSPAEKGGADVIPTLPNNAVVSQSSSSGNAVRYTSPSALAGSQSSALTVDYLASRSGNGWSTQPLDPPEFVKHPSLAPGRGIVRASSPDLSSSVISAINTPVVSGAPQEQNDLYLRDNTNGSYRLLTNTVISDPNAYFTPLFFEGASADYSHIVFNTGYALTPEAIAHGNDIYEWVGGQLRLASILPNGTPTEGRVGTSREYVSHAVSADGSRIFWTGAQAPRLLYMRDNGVSTVQVSSSVALFEGASSDGSKVIFSEEATEDRGRPHLFERDIDAAQTTDLTPASGSVMLGVVGASDDLSYVYLVAEGVLASGGTAGKPNLYVLHDDGGSWTTTFIATLSAVINGGDSNDWGPGGQGLGFRSSEVASDGLNVVFMSVESLTGYENKGDSEVYLYSVGSRRLTCVSCNPSGAAPAGPANVPFGYSNVYQARYLSSDGSRVFFDSGDALVPGDGNGLPDVYEWERDGSGSCVTAGGCVYLISGAASGAEAVFADASSSGEDVFFTTRAQLVGGDRDQNIDLYDARVGGGFQEPPVMASCGGAGCRAPVSSAPVLGSALSASFVGAGNVAAPAPVKAKPKAKRKPKPKKKAKAKKKKKRGKHGKRGKRAGQARAHGSLSVGRLGRRS